MDRCRGTNSLFVGGLKNSCRLTDANLKNLCAINQELCFLNSFLLFKTKNLEHSCAQVWPTNPVLIGAWNRVATASSMKIRSPPRAYMKSLKIYNPWGLMLLKSGNIRPIWRLITRSRWHRFNRILGDETEKFMHNFLNEIALDL